MLVFLVPHLFRVVLMRMMSLGNEDDDMLFNIEFDCGKNANELGFEQAQVPDVPTLVAPTAATPAPAVAPPHARSCYFTPVINNKEEKRPKIQQIVQEAPSPSQTRWQEFQ